MFVPIVLMGVSYGLFAGCAWNAIVYLVESDRVGTANGIISMIMNFGCAITPPFMGYLKDLTPDKDYGYFWPTRVSSASALIALGFCIWLYIFDLKFNGGILNMNV